MQDYTRDYQAVRIADHEIFVGLDVDKRSISVAVNDKESLLGREAGNGFPGLSDFTHCSPDVCGVSGNDLSMVVSAVPET
jgi:hypothetical protein